MFEICPNCFADSFTELRTDDGLITCHNCSEEFEEIPDGEDDPDLEDKDLED